MNKRLWPLYVGRFQPFHNGHLYAVNYILKRESGIMIAVGSCMNSHESENPFTFGERLLMISTTLDQARIPRKTWYAVGIPDTDFHLSWVPMVKALSLPFSTVYSNDPMTKTLFKEASYKIRGIPFLDKQRYSGTEIRRRMSLGEKWQDLVPKGTLEIIEQIAGEERIKSLGARR